MPNLFYANFIQHIELFTIVNVQLPVLSYDSTVLNILIKFDV